MVAVGTVGVSDFVLHDEAIANQCSVLGFYKYTTGSRKVGTYMKSMVRSRTAPNLPIRATAVAGGTSPRPASAAVRGRSRARAPRPKDVASENGTANHTNPPRR